jgi:titin
MVVSWSAPVFDGGCPVKSYALFIDDGITGLPITEVNTANDPDIRNKPTLRQATITSLTAGDLGTDYALKLQVETEMGTFESEVVTIRFATVPPQPSTAPQEDSTQTTASKVTVTYSSTDTGGSPILGYHLQYRAGLSGSFSDLLAESSNSMATSYALSSVTKGQTYYFRFRVKNKYGWSEYSAVGTAIASQEPDQASAPTISSVSDTTVVLDFDQSVDNMGSVITAYELYWATGETPGTFTQVGTYTDNSATFTLPNGADTITAGQIYNFRYAARNVRGLGELSEITSVAATNPLPAPTGLSKVDSSSSGSRITLTWDASTPVNTPGDDILGYRLYVLNSTSGQYMKIFDGEENSSPAQRTFSYSSVTQGQQYSFKVSVLTFNGESDNSTTFTTYACSSPSGMSVPSVNSVSLTSVTISWTPPSSQGGCSLTGYAVYLDDGSGFAEVNSANDATVRNKPELRTLTITSLGTATTGSTVKVKVTAFNYAGSVDSPAKSVLIATIPDSPTTSVTKVAAESDETQLTVEFSTLSTAEANGSPIISYS